MFEAAGAGGADGAAVTALDSLGAPAVAGWITALNRLDTAASDAEPIDQIRALEELKAAAAAAPEDRTTRPPHHRRSPQHIPLRSPSPAVLTSVTPLLA
jgi:hypothetical protein